MKDLKSQKLVYQEKKVITNFKMKDVLFTAIS